MPPRAILSSVCRTTCERLRVAGPGVVPQQDLEVHRVGKLGRLAEAAVARVEAAHHGPRRLVEQLGVERARALGSVAEALRSCSVISAADSGDLVPPFVPGPCTLEQDAREARPSRGSRSAGNTCRRRTA